MTEDTTKKITHRLSKKERIDVLCVERGLVESRQRAQALILAGQVIVDGSNQIKAGTKILRDTPIELKGEKLPYVSRGGLKLEGALDHFKVSVEDKIALDIGASTGGFTDCMLQRGAKHVICIDVGYGQLAWKLQQDPRVTNIERTNVRHLTPEDLCRKVDSNHWPAEFAVIDVSFISLTMILPAVNQFLIPGSYILALIKPQFEAERKDLKKGVVSDPTRRQAAIDTVLDWAENANFVVEGGVDSSIKGPKGNHEHLALLKTPGTIS